MSDGYKMTVKTHTHDPKTIKKLIDGSGLLRMLGDTISNARDFMSDGHFMKLDSPLHALEKADFDHDHPIVIRFFDNNDLSNLDSMPKLVKCYEDLNTFRIANLRTNLRSAYNALQNATNSKNDAVKLERVANKQTEKSSGGWQIESLNSIDNSFKFADTDNYETIKNARDLILEGEKDYLETAADLIKSVFSNITPKSNTRLAYTTLSTQDNEPYLLCPKGNFQGKSAVPMEVSKCRENCIDSRVAKDGTVTCAYQDWLKVAFEPQNKVLGRLDVHRHPDNQENRLNLDEGERAHKLSEGEFGYEFRLDHSDRGVNKIRNSDKNETDSREKQLSDRKPYEWGHVQDDEPKKAPRQAQSNPSKTIDTQLEGERKQQKGDVFLEALLRKLNGFEDRTDETREEQLNEDGLQANRGEMEESYPEQTHDGYYDGKERPYAPKDLKGDKEPSDSISHLLNKTAKKNDIRGLNDTLNNSRKDTKGDKTQEESLEDRHHKDAELDKSREELLAGLDGDDWGHQYSDAEFEDFLKDMGIDSKLEDKRNEYKVGD